MTRDAQKLTAALWLSSAICGGLFFSRAGRASDKGNYLESGEVRGNVLIRRALQGIRPYIGRMDKLHLAFWPKLQTEIPVQEGKSGTNRIKYHSESDDTNAGGAEMFFLFLCGSRTAGGERRKKMAKFLGYEDRLEIQNGLKEHLTFTEIGKRLGRDRTTIAREVRNYSAEQDSGCSVCPHNTCKYRKGLDRLQ